MIASALHWTFATKNPQRSVDEFIENMKDFEKSLPLVRDILAESINKWLMRLGASDEL